MDAQAQLRERQRKSERKWYETHRKEKCERTRLYHKAHPEQARESARNYRERNHEQVRERDRNYKKANPEKQKAHHALNNAIRAGKIVRQPCVICGNPKSHGHHPDYSRPLVVIWLCAVCHKLLHKLLKKEEED
jgi:hypothetical protein